MSNLGIAQSEITGASSSGSGTSVTFRGAWSNVTAYSTNDLVTRKGSVWIAATGNTGNDPYLDNGTNWTLFAEGFNYAGTWLVGTTYNFFDVVTYNNSFYLSVVAGSQSNTGHNPQTDNGTHWVLLDQGFHNLGTWSNLSTYQPYDIVVYLSSTYMGLTLNNIGNTPTTSPTNWQLLAAAGQVAPRVQYTYTMPSASITSVSITSNVVTLSCVNTFATQGEGTGQGQTNTIYISGLTGASFLNGQVLTIATISGTTITANFTHTNYGPTSDSGTATLSIPISGVFWPTGVSGSNIQLAPTFAISYIQCAQATRIELYSTATSRTNDASRPATTQPTQFTQHGVILDLNLDGVIASYTSWILSPLAYGANLDTAPTGDSNIIAALTNLSGSPTTNGFSITFTYTYEETGGANTPNSDQYVLGTTDTVNLPSAVANPTAYFGPLAVPATAGSLDDEFYGSSLNLSRWTALSSAGTISTSVSKSVLTLSGTSGTTAMDVIYQPTPATPWTVVAGPFKITNTYGVASTGVGLMVSDGTKYIYGLTNHTGTQEQYGVFQFSTIGTFSATSFTQTPLPWYQQQWLSVQDDGVNLNWYTSSDGVNFWKMFSQARLSFLSAVSNVGIVVQISSTGNPTEATVDTFRRTQ